MNSIRFGRGREYHFFRQEDIHRRWDLSSAVQFLNGFRADATVMASFRREVGREITASPANVSDEQVIQSLARMLVAGEFMVALPQRQPHRERLELRAPAAAPSAPRSSGPAEVVEDQPTFENDHDGVAQAAVLIAAARAGFPFCEECAKHAAQQAISKQAAKQAPSTPAAQQTASAPAAKQAATPRAVEKETSAPVSKQAATPPAVEKETSAPAPKQAANEPPAKQEPSAPAAKPETITAAANPPASPPAANPPAYWIEIELLGEDDLPVPGEKYVVILPGGEQRKGTLDERGWARIDELKTNGTCQVGFPELDKEAWQFVRALPALASS